MTDPSTIQDRLTGELLRPGDAGYDRARQVWNAMVDRRPRLIVRCATVDDVVLAVRTAREMDLEIGVRCGGHGVLGLAVPDDGLMIDLTSLAAVDVDPHRRTARVQGGALLGALDVATQQHGLATTAGNVSHTGIGGLTLGGGMGWLARRHGLTCDNVTAFEVVTADGTEVRASEAENPELFWGLRGGGGNFGIVTAFELRLHAVGTQALSVALDFPAEGATDVLAGWRDLALAAPREATFTARVGGGAATVGYVWVGDPGAGREQLAGVRSLGRPMAERVEDLSYLDLQRRDDTVEGHALRRYWKGHYFRDLPDEALALVAAHDPELGVEIQTYGGAIADVADDATAFSHRDAAFEYVAASTWTDPAEDDDRLARARRCAAQLAPFASGAYVNAISDEGDAGVRRAYPAEKLARLVALKDAYDPENVFHRNANIRPSGRASRPLG